MFPKSLLDRASVALELARKADLRIVTAETVTAGLVSACLTSVSGASQLFERGFVLYHSSAKATGLGVPETISAKFGAVSAEVTRALAEGALKVSAAGVSVAVTGYAGPGGGNEKDPVGTIYIAAARAEQPTLEERHVFTGERADVRLAALGAAVELLIKRLA